MSEFVLPTKPVEASRVNPGNLIIMAKAKTGKTSLLAALPNCLIIDTENGSDFVTALKVKVSSVAEIRRVGEAVINAKKPYKYIAIDSITALEDMCIPLAEDLYSKTPMGSKWFTEGKKKYGNILALPQGGGYQYLRQSFEMVVNYIKTLADNIILVGHVKDSMIEKNGVEVSSLELDLSGK